MDLTGDPSSDGGMPAPDPNADLSSVSSGIMHSSRSRSKSRGRAGRQPNSSVLGRKRGRTKSGEPNPYMLPLPTVSEHGSVSPSRDASMDDVFDASGVPRAPYTGPPEPSLPEYPLSRTRSPSQSSGEEGELRDDYDMDLDQMEPMDADSYSVHDSDFSDDEKFSEAEFANMTLGNQTRTRQPPKNLRLHRKQPYATRRVAAITPMGTRTPRVHTPFRGSLSTMPKLSWQHLAPGHYVAKARQGMTPGIRQHVLKLLSRASGYVWVNGKRMSVKRARGHLIKLLATRASVDIKLTNDFPFP
jgi:hypothetical protein